MLKTFEVKSYENYQKSLKWETVYLMRGVLKNQQGYFRALNDIRKKSKTDACKTCAKDVQFAYNCEARMTTYDGLMLNGIMGGWNIK